MVRQTLFFFADVKFLDVVDEFLFESVFVVVHSGEFLESFLESFADFLDACLFKGHDFFLERGDGIQFLGEFFRECFSFLLSEVNEMVQCFVNGGADFAPFFVFEFLLSALHRALRQADEHFPRVGRHGDSRLRGNLLHLLEIGLGGCGVQHGRGGRFVFFQPETEIHFSALKCLRNTCSDFHFLFSVSGSHTRGKVHAFAVERTNFDVNGFSFKDGIGFAETGH